MLSCHIIGIAKKLQVTNFNLPYGPFNQLKYILNLLRLAQQSVSCSSLLLHDERQSRKL